MKAVRIEGGGHGYREWRGGGGVRMDGGDDGMEWKCTQMRHGCTHYAEGVSEGWR